MKCKNCGAEMLVDTSVVYTSDPPMYKWKCPKCGCEEYHLTSEFEIDANTSESKLVIPDPWFNFRCQAAKDFVVGMLAHAHRYHPRDPKEKDWHKAIVEEGIEIADELVRQLKQSQNGNT